MRFFRSSRLEVFVKKLLLETSQNSQENTCARVSFLIKLQAMSCNIIKKEALALVLCCEFYQISKNTFSYRAHPVATSDSCFKKIFISQKTCFLYYIFRKYATHRWNKQFNFTTCFYFHFCCYFFIHTQQ